MADARQHPAPLLALPGPAFSFTFDGDFYVSGEAVRVPAEGGKARLPALTAGAFAHVKPMQDALCQAWRNVSAEQVER